MPTAPCERDACGAARRPSAAPDVGAGGGAWSSVLPAPRPWTSVLPAAPSSGFPVLVFSRAVCGLCWLCRYHFWAAGLAYEVRERGSEREGERER